LQAGKQLGYQKNAQGNDGFFVHPALYLKKSPVRTAQGMVCIGNYRFALSTEITPLILRMLSKTAVSWDLLTMRMDASNTALPFLRMWEEECMMGIRASVRMAEIS
jgi:hypothetical protein